MFTALDPVVFSLQQRSLALIVSTVVEPVAEVWKWHSSQHARYYRQETVNLT
jgi:hypothetical protein